MGHVSSEDIKSRQKLKALKDQIVQAKQAGPGVVRSILCPYCNTLNFENQGFCCETLRTGMITILMGLRQDEIEEHQRRHGN